MFQARAPESIGSRKYKTCAEAMDASILVPGLAASEAEGSSGKADDRGGLPRDHGTRLQQATVLGQNGIDPGQQGGGLGAEFLGPRGHRSVIRTLTLTL